MINTKHYMNEALKEATKGFNNKEVPVGAIAVLDNKIIARAHNKKNSIKNSMLHAEIILLNKVFKQNKDWRLNDIEIYVTLEPCMMCLGALDAARIKKLYYGASSNNKNYIYKGNMIIEGGILEKACSIIIKDFFKNRRYKE
ncbi:MAG: nucleoside deaminase [Bacilli bacterium]